MMNMVVQMTLTLETLLVVVVRSQVKNLKLTPIPCADGDVDL